MFERKPGVQSPTRSPVVVALLLLAFAAACSASEDVTDDRKEAKPLAEHEETFDPSQYREQKPEPEPVEPAQQPRQAEQPVTWIERVEKTMGFRVQLLSTTNIDDAQKELVRIRTKLDSLDVAQGRLDMTFDAPYYKVRLGDFLVKSPADSLRDLLREYGLTEAWVVRDRVNRIVREPSVPANE